MRVPDRCLADLREQGYLLFEGFLEADELAAAQEALWLHYPRPETYFADPAVHAWLATDQWAGEVSGPTPTNNQGNREVRIACWLYKVPSLLRTLVYGDDLPAIRLRLELGRPFIVR